MRHFLKFLSLIMLSTLLFSVCKPTSSSNNEIPQPKDFCEAIGKAYHFEIGKCPEPCDPKIMADLHDEAKGTALGNAVLNCMKENSSPDASCIEGLYTLLLEECETFTSYDSIEFSFCNYTVIYQYKGICKIGI